MVCKIQAGLVSLVWFRQANQRAHVALRELLQRNSDAADATTSSDAAAADKSKLEEKRAIDETARAL